MGFGGSQTERIDIIDSYDPRVTGRAASKGTLFRYVPSAGVPILLIKTDDGFSTNWISAGGGGGGGSYTASNVGVGTGVYKTTVGTDFQFKTLTAGANVTITTPTANEILISASGGGGGVTGLPDTITYFDNSGNAVSNVNARFYDATNSMLLLTTPGIVNATGSSSYIRLTGDGTGIVLASGPSSYISGMVQTGANITASGAASFINGFAFAGGTINATGASSIAFGLSEGVSTFIISNGQGSIASGYAYTAGQIISSSQGSLAMGAAFSTGNISALGRGSLAMGHTTVRGITASSDGCIAIGDGVIAGGVNSQSFGEGHTNNSYDCMVIGRYGATPGATVGSWVNTDPVFIVGNGTGVGSEATGFKIDKDGKVTTTASEVHSACRSVNSDTTLSTRTDRSIYVDTATATGNVTITFPAGETGLEYYVKDSGNNATVNNVLFAATGPDTIEASADITNNRGTRHFQYFSGVWYVMNLP